jgi:hypothetical protein
LPSFNGGTCKMLRTSSKFLPSNEVNVIINYSSHV